MVWVRVSGEIKFDDDIKKKERLFEQIPELKIPFQTPDNPDFKVFYLEHGKAIIDDFSHPRRTFEF